MCKQIVRTKLIVKYKNLDEKIKSDKKSILEKLDSQNLLFVNDNVVVDSNLCIILSCPGEEELISDRVCAGDTGENLENILKGVRDRMDIFVAGSSPNHQFGDRYSYTIINSINKVHFRAYNGAEAKQKDIVEVNNVRRILKLLSEIRCIKYFIICGNNAEILYNQIKNELDNAVNAKTTLINHLGWVGIRNEYKNSCPQIKGIKDPSKRDERRIELIVEKIIEDFT